MAKRVLLECDACGGRKDVSTASGKRGGIPFTVDLCGKCWAGMLESYAIQSGIRIPKREFIVYDDISDIPR